MPFREGYRDARGRGCNRREASSPGDEWVALRRECRKGPLARLIRQDLRRQRIEALSFGSAASPLLRGKSIELGHHDRLRGRELRCVVRKEAVADKWCRRVEGRDD